MIYMDPTVWQQLSLSVLAVIISVALVADIRSRRIPNQLVLTGLFSGLVLHAIGPQAGLRVAGLFTLYPGALGISGALWGALVGFITFIPFYLVRVFGAGDVKLMTAVGSFAGLSAVINIALFVLVSGGIIGALYITWSRSWRVVISNGYAILMGVVSKSPSSFDPTTKSVWRMPYSAAVALGLIGYGAWIFSGNYPLIDF